MLPKLKNDKLAIGAFVFVMAIDALLSVRSGGPGGFIVLWLVINLPGVLLISFLTLLFRLSESSGVGLAMTVIACLFSAAFWSFIFGYVLPFKRAA